MKNKILAIISLFLTVYTTHAQEAIQMPSADVASLGNYIEMPVSHNTGIPNISIPIYEINAHGYKFPINLSYHATAINPNVHPGWVGMNWTLITGGTISRVTKGRPDDLAIKEPDLYDDKFYAGRYFNTDLHTYFEGNETPILQYGEERFDSGNDVFSFSFNGNSGKFILDYNHSKPVILNNNSNLIIEVDEHLHEDKFWSQKYMNSLIDDELDVVDIPMVGNSISGFTITDANGYKYHFGGIDSQGRLINVTRSTYVKSANPTYTQYVSTDAWHLDKVYDPYGNELLSFEYKGGSWSNTCEPLHTDIKPQMNYSWSFNYNNAEYRNDTDGIGSDASLSYTGTLNIIYPSYLERINFPGGTVAFNTSESEELQMDYMKLWNNYAEFESPLNAFTSEVYGYLLNKYVTATKIPYSSMYDISTIGWEQLDYITITGDDGFSKEFNFTYTQNNRERLRLLELKEDEKPSYYFDYYGLSNRRLKNEEEDDLLEEGYLPYADTRVDQWGYYNGYTKKFLKYFGPEDYVYKPSFSKFYEPDYSQKVGNPAYSIDFLDKVWDEIIEATYISNNNSNFYYYLSQFEQSGKDPTGSYIGSETFRDYIISEVMSEENASIEDKVNTLAELGYYLNHNGRSDIFERKHLDNLHFSEYEKSQYFSYRDWVEHILTEYDLKYNGYYSNVVKARVFMSSADHYTGNVHHCLSNIYYPTGGRTEYEYEPHEYEWTMERSPEGKLFVAPLYSGKRKAGGIRIKSIKSFDDKTTNIPSLTKGFTYEMGVLTGVPQFFNYTTCIFDLNNYDTEFGTFIDQSGIDVGELKYFSTTSPIPCSSNGTGQHISYSKVTETQLDKNLSSTNGKTVYYTRNFKNHPDLYTEAQLQNKEDEHLDIAATFNTFPCSKGTWVIPDISFEQERGKLLGVDHYSDNRIVREERYQYKYTPGYTHILLEGQDVFNAYFHADIKGGGLWNLFGPRRTLTHSICGVFYNNYSYLKILSPCNLESKIVKDYLLDDKEIITTNKYFYEYDFPHTFLDKSTSTTSDGESVETRYTYVNKLFVSDIYYALYNNNRVATPIETIVKKGDDVIGGSLIEYRNDDENGFIVKGNTYELQKGVPSTGGYYSGRSVNDAYWKKRESFDKYNSLGKISEYHQQDGIYKYYVWAFNQQYPVAEVQSSTRLSNFSAIVEDTDLLGSDILSDVQSDIAYLKAALSTYISNNNCRVSLYTYKPLLGVTSITDPNGQTAYYEYDSFNRLKCIKDHDGNILKVYEYNYRQQ